MIPELIQGGAAATARRLAARECSAHELVTALLDRIDEVNPQVNAIRVVHREEALAAADAADRRRAAGEPARPLDGVPITVKENVDVAGDATTQGAVALADAVATADAPAVAHLRAAGAIVVGRTNMPDLALRWHTDSGIAGPTVNPWDPGLTPGGSSGGEAVALATGMSVLGVGTDLGGSLRWPSACAGTVALRPTLGRVAQASSLGTGAVPAGLALLDVTGPMARRVEDLELALPLMAAPDPRDPWHCPLDAHHVPPAPRRVHVLTQPGGGPVDPAVSTALERAARALDTAGYELVEAAPPGLAEIEATWGGLMAGDARHLWPALGPLASPAGQRFMAAMFELVPARDADGTAELFVTRQRLGRAWGEYQAHTPLVLAPVFATAPFAPGADLDGVEAAARIVAALRATLVANVLGLPAVAVGAGHVDGRPQGVQILGPRFGEQLCLRAARAVEAAHPPETPISPRLGSRC